MSDIDVFRLLLDRGLDLPPDALRMAARKKRPDITEEIMRRQKPANLDAALYDAVKRSTATELKPGEEEPLLHTITSLIDAGASPSTPNDSGEALVAAILRGPASLARLLRDRGANVDWSRIDDHNYNPAKIAYGAVLENRLDRLEQLEKLGMPLDALGPRRLAGRTGWGKWLSRSSRSVKAVARLCSSPRNTATRTAFAFCSMPGLIRTCACQVGTRPTSARGRWTGRRRTVTPASFDCC